MDQHQSHWWKITSLQSLASLSFLVLSQRWLKFSVITVAEVLSALMGGRATWRNENLGQGAGLASFFIAQSIVLIYRIRGQIISRFLPNFRTQIMSGFRFKKKEYWSILVITLAYICSQNSSNVFKAPENKGQGVGGGGGLQRGWK